MIKLEEIFLMNVCLHLPMYRDIYNFIQINKKCHRSVCSLKINPRMNGYESIKAYLDHFTTGSCKKCSGLRLNFRERKSKIPAKNVRFLLESIDPRIFDLFLESFFHKKRRKIMIFIDIYNTNWMLSCIYNTKRDKRIIKMFKNERFWIFSEFQSKIFE